MPAFVWDQTEIEVITREPQIGAQGIPRIQWSREQSPTEGVTVFWIELEWAGPVVPEPFEVSWSIPLRDIQSLWTPDMPRGSLLPPDWAAGYRARATANAPIICGLSATATNRITVAASELVDTVVIRSGVREEDASLVTRVEFFTEPIDPIAAYRVALRFDTRSIPYDESLDAARAWWETLPEWRGVSYLPMMQGPVYSTWYSFHQALELGPLLLESRLAKELGCEMVIVDDGWQTVSTERGYAYCGDW